MKLLLLAPVAVLVLTACSAGKDGTLRIRNTGQETATSLRINIVRGSPDGRFQTQPAGPHDQLYEQLTVRPDEAREIFYQSLSEYDIDVFATWENGKTARFAVGYVSDLSLTPTHDIELTDGEIRIDGKLPTPVQYDPEQYRGRSPEFYRSPHYPSAVAD